MAVGARFREKGRRMIRISCAVVFTGMAGIAVGRSPGINAGDVAIGALNSGVCARQWETCFAVIKNCGAPCGGAVAESAVLWEAGTYVIGICGACEFRKMTGHTRSWQGRVLTAAVACGAL